MKKALFCLALCCLVVQAFAQRFNIIPAPVELYEQPGEFIIDKSVVIVAPSAGTQLDSTLQWFSDRIATATGFHLKTAKTGTKVLRIVLSQADKQEGYKLKVTPTEITLKAPSPAGVFYGLQTLLQLLPPDIESSQPIERIWSVPCTDIIDYPRFGWRGLMLDVSRHFYTKEEVKRYIDEMARYKYNIFHWHLSDDNGWRIEIKSLPELTKVGAWRVARTGRWGTFESPQPGEPAKEGGFYTQEDIKEILAYAQARYITVLPEIDVPAHSLAMIAAYPNLSCTQLHYNVNPGSHFYKKEDNALCIGNDSVYLVLDKVFTEIAALFPFNYIHVGGDEAYKGFWDNCPKCRKRMEQENLKNVDELQSYFVKRLEKILRSKGKKLIGWDEILEGGLAPEATVMSWRGMKGGIEAAKMNHHVVMSPWEYCYLDLYQGDPAAEPPTYGMCRLSDSYNYDPVPDGVDEKYILGGQGNLWTESIANYRHIQYMTWPRALALSEVYWSPKAKRNWNKFVQRMEVHFVRFDTAHIKYSRSAWNAIVKPSKDNNGQLSVQLSTEIKGLDIYYTFDNSDPDNMYPQYTGQPLVFPAGAANLSIVTYHDGKKVGELLTVGKEELLKRLKDN
ncbi:beta-N-acetylhexosaminidase [Chitinophaga pinensis]|uniref:beta-N-acetylhexosaminidase n=1 Tax=Chitinophaga pinensis (strain ATCC 43595 / DSM 2588 / LMG 13176 / NBRC 15968 / NCIMB 11800 / UQM 2034) TaxID=485918 RepID=A0A979G1T8_CHIPD|nr:family 20 glycosylhydrolase [Chitinophaga pinensis]ACU59294.1 Beta-N-acetylhexosaminidase [Chitinophaga pinensis DSM 2588]